MAYVQQKTYLNITSCDFSCNSSCLTWAEPSVCGSVCPFLAYSSSSSCFLSCVDTPRRRRAMADIDVIIMAAAASTKMAWAESDPIHIKMATQKDTAVSKRIETCFVVALLRTIVSHLWMHRLGDIV